MVCCYHRLLFIIDLIALIKALMSTTEHSVMYVHITYSVLSISRFKSFVLDAHA